MVGTVLLQITATDVDLRPMLTYFLINGNDTFSIDKYSGAISVAKPLDYETFTSYNLTVMVNSRSILLRLVTQLFCVSAEGLWPQVIVLFSCEAV
jgi:hypothetical protein